MLLEITEDRLLPDGRRYIVRVFPEFNILEKVIHPVGYTNERVIKDAKQAYHDLWEAKKRGELPVADPTIEPGPLLFNGKKLKWDRDAEKIYMDTQLSEEVQSGESERIALETKKTMEALFG